MLVGIPTSQTLPTGPAGDLPLDSRSLSCAGLDGCLDLLPYPRHGEEDVGAHFPQVFAQLVETLCKPGARAVEDGVVEGDDLFGDVAQWQIADEGFADLHSPDLGHLFRCPDDVVVSQHHGLRSARGAGCVDQLTDIVRLQSGNPILVPLQRGVAGHL